MRQEGLVALQPQREDSVRKEAIDAAEHSLDVVLLQHHALCEEPVLVDVAGQETPVDEV